MRILSNSHFFPLLQLALFAFLLFAVWSDYGPRTGGKNVTRAAESMSVLEKLTGLVIAAIITIVNKNVFDDNETRWHHYSAVINAFDLIAIVYLCYLSPWCRNKIIGFNNRS